MSRSVRLPESLQPTLLLGHGPVHWDTLPGPVRERVLALWLQLLTEHLADGARGTASPATADAPKPSAEKRP